MMRARLALLAVLAAAIAGPFVGGGRAWACTCVPDTPRASLAGATAVFVGVPTRVEQVDPDTTRADFVVSDVYKGDVAPTVPLTSGGGGDACAFDFVPGTRYVIFAEGDLARGLRTSGSCTSVSDDLGILAQAGLGEQQLLERFEVQAVASAEQIADDGPGLAGPRAPRSGPIAAAGVLLLAAAIGTITAYRARGSWAAGGRPGLPR
jgi:hypothetical protein